MSRTFTDGWFVQSVSQKVEGAASLGLDVVLKKDNEMVKISISNPPRQITDELKQLKSGTRQRCYFWFGMHDIDLYSRVDGTVVIENSPHEGEDHHYGLASREELGKLIRLTEQLNLQQV